MDYEEKAAEQLGFQSWPCLSLAAGMGFHYSIPAWNEHTAASGSPRATTAEYHPEQPPVLSQERFTSPGHTGQSKQGRPGAAPVPRGTMALQGTGQCRGTKYLHST